MPTAAEALMGLVPRFLVKIDASKYDFGSWSTASTVSR